MEGEKNNRQRRAHVGDWNPFTLDCARLPAFAFAVRVSLPRALDWLAGWLAGLLTGRLAQVQVEHSILALRLPLAPKSGAGCRSRLLSAA